MRTRIRVPLFLVAAVVMAALFYWFYGDLPPVGRFDGAYTNFVARHAVAQRHATDIVNAVTYDYRAIDTLGEEFILFASVIGVLLLFRRQPEQRRDRDRARPRARELEIAETEAVGAMMLAIVAAMVVFGIYEVTHGQLTPGGGFQGGVILATAPLVLYIAGRPKTYQRAVSHPVVEIAEAVGAAGYALIGIAALVTGATFLTNWLPLGETRSLLSSGTIAAISVSVGLEVSGSFALLMYSYLKETISGEGGE